MSWDDAADVTIGLALAISAFAAYLTGRVHQWSRHGGERRQAYCRGYDKASNTLLQGAPTTRVETTD